MKKIQGKVKFLAVPTNELLPIDILNIYRRFGVLPTNSNSLKLSGITEQQAAELVDCPWKSHESPGYVSVKNTLIKLLKENDCWIKEWKEKPEGKFIDIHSDKVDWKVGIKKMDYKNTPDDYLLIKL